MKKYNLFLALLFGAFGFYGQNHITWSGKVVDDGCEATLKITATIEDGYHFYTQYPCEECYFLGTIIEFENPSGYKTIGKTKEPEPQKKVDKYGDTYIYFEHGPVVFTQKIEKLTSKDFTVDVYVDYQACDELACVREFANISIPIKGSTCANEEIETIDSIIIEDTIKKVGSTIGLGQSHHPLKVQLYTIKTGPNTYDLITTGSIALDWKLRLTRDSNPVSFSATEAEVLETIYLNTEEDSLGVIAKDRFTIIQKIKTTAADSTLEVISKFRAHFNGAAYNGDVVTVLNLNEAFTDNDADDTSKKSYLTLFIIAFLSGFVALVTPCVFPMIPMTVSFFTKQSKTVSKGIRNAVIYGLSIIVIYVGLGLLVTMIFGSSALNALSTNVWFNIFFFLLLLVFGISFLGAFEIRLPNSWVNKADKQADKGGLIGIFFMAFTLALVSFSCTGPIIGTLLVEAATQGGMAPFVGMLGFSTALALPFMLFAAFPGWMNSLPQSGGWLNAVKVVLGLLEIAFSFKFLSNADLVVQGHFLEREVFIALWVVIFALMGFYLLGKIRLPHDSPMTNVKVPRFMMAIMVFSFVVYLIPGLWGAPLKLISGFPPPTNYSESPYGIGGSAPSEHHELPDGGHFGPHGLILFHDLEEGQQYANEQGLPVMIDFTGLACVNCRRMEQNVWSEDNVLPILKEKVVIVSLHVDDKAALPSKETFTSPNGFKVRTIGDKWSNLQRLEYGSNSQPQYFILDNNGQRMGGPASYEDHGESKLFETWLKDNLKEYELRKNVPSYEPEMSEG